MKVQLTDEQTELLVAELDPYPRGWLVLAHVEHAADRLGF
jgi:hypothetical protein